jgi:hypothetical protein
LLYSKALLENHYKFSFIPWSTPLRKSNLKILICISPKTYANTFAKDILYKCYKSNKVQVSKEVFENKVQILILKIILWFYREWFWKPNYIWPYAIKPFKQIIKIFLKTLLCFENLPSYCSGMLLWILESFTNWFEAIWTKFEKDIKEIENRKRKRRKEERKIRNGPGKRFGPVTEAARGPPRIISQTGISSASLSLTSGARVSSLTPAKNFAGELSPSRDFLPFDSVDPLPISLHPCVYKIRPISSLSSTPFSPLSAARLREIEHTIPQTPPRFTDESSELRSPRAYSFAPFPFLNLRASPRHAHRSSCDPGRRVRPRLDLAIHRYNSDEQSPHNRSSSRSFTSPPRSPRHPAPSSKITTPMVFVQTSSRLRP